MSSGGHEALYQIPEIEQLSPETKKLLGKLLKQGISELKPSLNKKGIQYIEIEKNLEANDSVLVEDMLQELVKEGILEPIFVDRVLTCPDCNSPEVYSKYACPKCETHNVDYMKWLEHTKCGYMASETKFMNGSSLVCPKCQAKFEEGMKDIDLRKMGSIYQCEKCGYRFDRPEIIHICQQCKKTFDYQETKYIKIFAYKIADKDSKKLSKELPLFESLGEILQERNFETQFNTQLTGESGVEHSFAIVAKRKHDSLVIDVSLTGDDKDAILLLGKKTDVKPTLAILIDLSEGDKLLSLGKTFGITILKGGNEQQLESELDNLLASLD